MLRLIRTKFTAALALSGLLQKFNADMIQLDLGHDIDGIIQLAGELVQASFQLQEDADYLEDLKDKLSEMERQLTSGQLNRNGLSNWERMYRLAKLDGLKAQLKEAMALVLAYRELPLHLDRPIRRGQSVAQLGANTPSSGPHAQAPESTWTATL